MLVSRTVGLDSYIVAVKWLKVVSESETALIQRSNSSIPFFGRLLSTLIYLYTKQ